MRGITKGGRSAANRSERGGARRRAIATGVVLLAGPAAGHAAGWSVDPAVAVFVGYESNPGLTTETHNGTSEGSVVPALNIRRLTETSAVDVGILGRGTYYTRSEYQDTNEAQVALTSFVQSTERTRLSLDAVSRWDSLFESAVLGSGTGNLQDVDVGLANTKVRRRWLEATPYLTYGLTERSSVSLLYRLTDVRFEDVGASGLVDYQQNYVSGSYSYSLTPTNDLSLIVLGSQYRPAEGTDTDTAEILAGFSHAFSATASAGLHAGIGKATDTLPDGSQFDTSIFVLEVRGSQKSERSQLDAVISRDVQPSGGGQAVSTDQVRLDWNRDLSETTALVLRSTVFRNNSLRGTDPTVDRLYGEAAAGVDWVLAPDWSIGVRYQYRYQKYDAAENSASSHGLFVGVGWAPPRAQ
jgi:hypothetical protein